MDNELQTSDFDYRSLFDLKNRVAIVTGGAGALGETFVYGLLNHRAKVVIVDIDEERGKSLENKIREDTKGEILFCPADVSDENAMANVLDQTVAAFGGVDILINNAAAPVGVPEEFFEKFEDYKLSEWRRQMEVSLDGMFIAAKETVKCMKKQNRGGSIVQISSIYGVLSSDERIYEGALYRGNYINNPISYSTAKAGVLGMTRWMACNLAKYKIRVNSIAPGGVNTGENETFKKRYGDRVPMTRMANKNEIVGGVLYLASDASSYVTGQCLNIDGGLSAW